ncbi:HAD family hydrolase [Aliikangiella maris]|uniref:HAD family hydrolase n=2 Tax=Aliikangiella maris TaxID=3162458 RepID=A0ABV3MQC8_9GAMM
MYQFNASIKLLSFDLDNALYDNRATIEAAELSCQNYLQSAFSNQGVHFEYEKFWEIRKQLVAQNNPAFDDLTYLRLTVLIEFCKPLNAGETIAKQALAAFLQQRSKVDVEPTIQSMLSLLVKHFTLVSTSNGNCDINQTIIAPFFSKNYFPVGGMRAKPHPAMLHQCMADFSITASQLVHIGDSIEKDGGVAEAIGARYLHFAPFESDKDLAQSCHELCLQLSSL